MKRLLFAFTLFMAHCALMTAGGLMTNTNYHIAFDRMFARGATFQIDAAYSNPAGLAWGEDGWQLSLNLQKPWQNRNIDVTIPGFLGQDFQHKYKGKASAPVVPALFAAYKDDRWAVSTMIGIVGSGGFVQYDDGVPMFNVPMAAILGLRGIMPTDYTLDSQMKGKQYIYGGQVNFTYRLLDCLSAAVGVRANYYDGYYRGHVVAQMGNTRLVNMQMDCVQRGWGFAPIFSVDFHQGPLTLAARYELRTKLNPKNDTRDLQTEIAGMDQAVTAALLGDKVRPYMDGEHTRYDMPALLSVAAGFEITPQLRAALEYHYFDDKHAKMGNDRQLELKHGTYEFLAGVEYDIDDRFTISCGGQRTDYGLTDNYQQNTSFACDSYSLGLGGAVNLTDQLRLNVSYFCSIYSDYKKEIPSYFDTTYKATEVYSRTNHVIGIGLDYKF